VAKYTQKQIDALGAEGHAFRNPDDTYSYPIDDVEDLKSAIHAVGRGNADHDDIRAYIIRRAKAMGQADLIPDNWTASGALKDRKKQHMNKQETRTFPLSNVEVRTSQDGSMATFVGYASMTNAPYAVQDFMGSYDETIRSGAFKKTLTEAPNVPLLFNHDGMPIASTGAGTMTLSEDSNGLRVDATLDRRQALTNDLCIALERGDLKQMSFSFEAVKQQWSEDRAARDVTEVKLYDASIVTYPANPMTTAALRADLQRHLGTEGRARLIEVERVMGELREGKTISAANADLLQAALDALHTADDKLSQVQPILEDVNSALDDGQKAISATLDTRNPDGDPADTGFEDKNSTNKDNSGNKPVADGTTDGGAGGSGDPNSPSDGAGLRTASNHPAPSTSTTRTNLTPQSVLETRAMLEALTTHI
jgi:uncharacterized protein